MQKSVISNTLNIARTFKINTQLGRYGLQFLGFCFFSRNLETQACWRFYLDFLEH